MVKKKDNDSSTLTPEIIDDSNKRDFYIAVIDDTINQLHYKITNGRIRDNKKDKLKTDMCRALFYGVSVANNVYKDKQIDKLADDFDKLKRGLLIKDETPADALSDAELDALLNIDERIKKLSDENSGDD